MIMLSTFSHAAWSAEKAELFFIGFYLPGVRDVNQADLKISLQMWADEIGRAQGIQTKMVLYENMQTLRNDVIAQRINMIVAPGMELAEAFSPEELAEGFSSRPAGTEVGLALIVAKNSGIRKFSDLRGKHVLRQSNDRLAEIFLEMQCRQQAGVSCRDYLSIDEVNRDMDSVYKVFFGKAEAALVSLSTLHVASELNPQVNDRLSILLDWKSSSVSYGMMTVYSEAGFRTRMILAALQSFKTPRGRQIMEIFHTENLEPVNSKDLRPYWQLNREYLDLLDKKTTRKK